MYRNLIEKTQQYLKEQHLTCEKEVDLSLVMTDYPGLSQYLYDYLENHYLVRIPEHLKEECRTLDDVYEMMDHDIFTPASCMETYAILQGLNIGYRKYIPTAFLLYLSKWIEKGDYRWDLPKDEKYRMGQSPLNEIDLSEYRVLPSTVFYVEDAVLSYLLEEPGEEAEAVKVFPPESEEERKKREKEEDWYRYWPYTDDLPIRFRYPARVIREAEKAGEPIWEVKIYKSYERYLVLKHRADSNYTYEHSVFVRPNSTVSYYYDKEKIEFYDYIKDDNGKPLGIQCLITGGDGETEETFTIQELYLHKEARVSSVSDTLINHYYHRRYELTD